MKGNQINFRTLLPLLMMASGLAARAELRVPAFTAYLEPEAPGARVSSRSGVTGWVDPKVKVLWFGEFKTPGSLEVALALRLPTNGTSRFRLTTTRPAGRIASTVLWE